MYGFAFELLTEADIKMSFSESEGKYRLGAVTRAFRVLLDTGATVTYVDLLGSDSHANKGRTLWAGRFCSVLRTAGLLVRLDDIGSTACYRVAGLPVGDQSDEAMLAWSSATPNFLEKARRDPASVRAAVASGTFAPAALPPDIVAADVPAFEVPSPLGASAFDAPSTESMLAALVNALPNLIDAVVRVEAAIGRLDERVAYLHSELGGGPQP